MFGAKLPTHRPDVSARAQPWTNRVQQMHVIACFYLHDLVLAHHIALDVLSTADKRDLVRGEVACPLLSTHKVVHPQGALLADDLILTAVRRSAPTIEDCRSVAWEPQGACTLNDGVDLVQGDMCTHNLLRHRPPKRPENGRERIPALP